MNDEHPEVEPTLDPTPEQGPGGPDAIERDEDDFPIVTPDQPRNAQIDDQEVPEEVTDPDEGQQEGRESGPESQEPNGDDAGEDPA